MKKLVAFLFVLSVVVGASAAGGAGAATTPPTLTGETLLEVQEANATPHLTGECAWNPDGSTTLTITAAGPIPSPGFAIPSSYPGTFVETVSATFDPQVGPAVLDSAPLQGSWGWGTGSITALSAHFEITSESATITGDKHFDASAAPVEFPGFPIIATAQNTGLCRDVAGEVPPGTDGFPSGTPALWGYFHTLDVATTSYTAVIDTGSERFFDRGRSRLVVRNACADFINDSVCIANSTVGGANLDVFAERFESDLAAPVAIPPNGTVVSGGETVDTDPNNAGPSPEAPVQTLLTVPAIVDPGVLTITPQAAGAPPAGFVLLGTEVVLEGPPASSATDPYVVRFSIDASLLDGLDPSAITVFRNDAAVLACTDTSSAVPDPCVAETGLIPGGGGDGFVSVRTTEFSKWGFGLHIEFSKEACRSNGWRALVDNLGHSFSNQGDCVSFVTTGGKNKA